MACTLGFYVLEILHNYQLLNIKDTKNKCISFITLKTCKSHIIMFFVGGRNFRHFSCQTNYSNSVKFYRNIPVLIFLSCFDTKYFCPYVKYQHMHDDNDYCNFSFCCIFALMIPSTTDLDFTATCLSANRLQIFFAKLLQSLLYVSAMYLSMPG